MSAEAAHNLEDNFSQLITVTIHKQLFGIPVQHVRDIFKLTRITRIPMTSPEIAGVVNLRGRIVTALNLREKLGFPQPDETIRPMMIAVDYYGEMYSLMVDSVGEVLTLSEETFEKNPSTLDQRLQDLTKGIFKLDNQLLSVLDIKKIINLPNKGFGGE